MIKKLSLPLQLILAIGFAFLLGDFSPMWLTQLLYSVSILFKTFLALILPFMVFSFIVSGCLAMKRNAPRLLGVLIFCIAISNALVAWVSYYCTNSVLSYLTWGIQATTPTSIMHLEPIGLVSWTLRLLDEITLLLARIPVISYLVPLRAEYAMIAAILLGLVAPMLAPQSALLHKIEAWVIRLKKLVEHILMRIFIPLLPFYVLGFLLELNYRHTAWNLVEYYGRTFCFIFALQIAYLVVMYAVANWFSIKKTIAAIRNSLPSYLAALSTMSSTATIPVTIECAEKNTNNRPLAEVATPILANIHLAGDAVTIPALALVTTYLFQGTIVSPATFAIFIWYFCQAMLAVAGVPGGGIMVMIPILESILGFNPEMISLITTLYLLQDAFGTAANVMGDGALMIIVNKIIGNRTPRKEQHG